MIWMQVRAMFREFVSKHLAGFENLPASMIEKWSKGRHSKRLMNRAGTT